MQERKDTLETSSARKRRGQHALGEELGVGEERVLELREEELVANKELRDVGEIIVRTEIETVPAEMEVESQREEVEVEHEPVGQSVTEREDPREEDGVLVWPVYEEQLVLVKRLVLRERVRIRRVSASERRLFQDTVRRERLVIDDPHDTRLVHEVYPDEGEYEDVEDAPSAERSQPDFLTRLVSKALE